MKTLIYSIIKIQNASYHVQNYMRKNGTIIIVGLIIWAVLSFVAWVSPALVQNIWNDILNAH